MKVPCTACRYCMPCPSGVNIPECFTLFHKFHMTGDQRHSTMMYAMSFSPEERASHCVECGRCESHCPQTIETFEAPAESKD